MIDYFSLILGHALLTFVIFQVMMRDDAEPSGNALERNERNGRNGRAEPTDRSDD